MEVSKARRKKEPVLIWLALAGFAFVLVALAGSMALSSLMSMRFRQGRKKLVLSPSGLASQETPFTTGDVLMAAYYGTQKWRLLLENLTRSNTGWNYFHVAMIVVPPRGVPGEEMVWELTTDSEGPVLIRLRSYLEKYQEGRTIVVRKLLRASDGTVPREEQRNELFQRFAEAAPELKKRARYSFNVLEQFAGRHAKEPSREQRNSAFICSTMVGETLEKMGLCDFKRYGPRFLPAPGDFEDDSRVLEDCLDPEFRYSEELRLLVARK